VLAAQAPAYSTAQLQCVRFGEVVDSRLTVESAGRMGSATSGREGDLIVTAGGRGSDQRIPLVAWYDSLRMWRVAGNVRLEPDASGFIGGQYRGHLLPDGSFVTRERPFVPDALREVADLSAVLDDLLPRLPLRALQVGEEWRSGDTLAIQRLADSALAQRYRIRITRSGEVVPQPGDTLTPAYTRDLTDEGTAVWSMVDGPLRYERRSTVVATIPAGGAVKQVVRSQLEQHTLLERRPGRPDCSPAPAGSR
jgi:hypothetical protein